MTFISRLNLSLNTFNAYSERSLDLPGYLPYIGTKSAPIRACLALWQLVASVVTLVAFFFYQILSIVMKASAPLSKEDVVLLGTISYNHFLGGLGNLFRSIIESIPFVNTLVLGLYDVGKSYCSLKFMSGSCQTISPYLHYPLVYQTLEHLKGRTAFFSNQLIA